MGWSGCCWRARANFATLPANKPWTLGWDNPNPTSLALRCDLFYGTNKVATLTTNDFSLVGVTNGISSFEAVVDRRKNRLAPMWTHRFEPVGNIVRNKRTHCNECAVTDFDAGAHDRAEADKRSLTNSRVGSHERPAGNMRIVAND